MKALLKIPSRVSITDKIPGHLSMIPIYDGILGLKPSLFHVPSTKPEGLSAGGKLHQVLVKLKAPSRCSSSVGTQSLLSSPPSSSRFLGRLGFLLLAPKQASILLPSGPFICLSGYLCVQFHNSYSGVSWCFFLGRPLGPGVTQWRQPRLAGHLSPARRWDRALAGTRHTGGERGLLGGQAWRSPSCPW